MILSYPLTNYLHSRMQTRAHEFYSGYMESDLMPVVMTLLDLVKRPGLEDSHVFKKYASSQFMRGAEYVKDCLAKWGW